MQCYQTAAMSQNHAEDRRSRRKKYVRTGCRGCKLGHCKCDEQQPVCGRCQRLRLACGYVSTEKQALGVQRQLLPVVSTTVDLKISATPVLLKLAEGEVVYFECFRDVVANRLSRQTDAPDHFWLRTVPRESVRDRCVLEAIIAIGALFRAKTAHFDLYDTSSTRAPPDVAKVSHHQCVALKYYTQALSTLRTRIAQAAPRDAPRTVLVITMLIAVFEFLQGNHTAVDRVTASCIQFLRAKCILAENRPSSFKVAAHLDDEGVDEAQYFMARKMAMSAVSSPLCPRTKQSMLSLSNAPLCTPEPPELGSEARQYAQVWWRSFAHIILWFLQVQSMTLDSLPTTALGDILAEQQHILTNATTWIETTESLMRRATDPKEKFTLGIVVLSARIVYLCTYCCFDLTGMLWRANNHRWEQIKEASYAIMADSGLQALDRDYLYDWLACGLVQIARECRDAVMRHEALLICKKLAAYHITFEAKCFIMGAEAIVTAEDEYRDGNDCVPFRSKYTWTSASWDQAYTELHVTLISRLPFEGVRQHKALSISSKDMGLESHHVQQYVSWGSSM